MALVWIPFVAVKGFKQTGAGADNQLPPSKKVTKLARLSTNYSECDLPGFRSAINRQNTAKEIIASHQGLNTIGNRTMKTRKTIHRHVGTSRKRALIDRIAPQRLESDTLDEQAQKDPPSRSREGQGTGNITTRFCWTG
jgi:hypothetical protein